MRVRARLLNNKRVSVTAKNGVMPRKVPVRFFVIYAIVGVLAALALVLDAIRTDPVLAERWTVGFAQNFMRVVGTLTSWIPFSVFEFFVVAAIIAAIVLFVRLVICLCKAEFLRIIKSLGPLGTVALTVVDLYLMSMGFGYYRAVMPLLQAGNDYRAAETIASAEYFLEDFNALARKLERDENGLAICPYTLGELSELIAKEYDKLNNDYFFSYSVKAKPVVNSFFLSDISITGITFLPTGEANINMQTPPSERVAVIAHEIAHTKGVQREGDANLAAYTVLLISDNDYLRYCGYFNTFYSFISAIALNDEKTEYIRVYDKIDRLVNEEYEYGRTFWNSRPDFMSRISSFFNDIYLKLNGAINGVGSYGDGHKSEVIKPVDPDTGETTVVPVYSKLQKIYFYLYEQRS